MPGAPIQTQEERGAAATDGKPVSRSQTAEERVTQGIRHEGLLHVLRTVVERDPNQPVFDRRPELLPAFEAICEPERTIVFRVPWLDDSGKLRVNRGFRVQFSSAIGPYKGGLRFREGVRLSIIKMLGFEQIFKNALTTLPMGGGKGGSDFDPKGKSEGELQRFCQSFMTKLYRHIGNRVDIPAGDIGCGSREIAYLFGQYRRITGTHTGAITGKGVDFGGSEIRPEATGYGCVYFAECMLESNGERIEGKRCIVTGSGNVAQFCAVKLVQEGAVVLALSDSKGYVYEKKGFSVQQLEQIMRIKASHHGSLDQYNSDTAQYVGDSRKPWEIDARYDLAFPCATQNEVDLEAAERMVNQGVSYVFEGANMPCTAEAVEHFEAKGVGFGPAKAVNAGGVAVSGLEMAQNRVGIMWSRQEVDDRLKTIMHQIYKTARDAAKEYGVSLAAGANIAGFLKVGEAVLAQGAV
ncbi:glutamate isoform B [Micractinium conductrix]|uniref:Glutamate dehydrogenase n=1 Tax=Micractinium conductrix TaxID=554055 RepID=A0A2P6V660_9CHLO|nr:glutamate isoform B [Micractinium conductrix]|eukprot:PSC69576.1 glutamate isoform B [Micractinium conductrix]